MSTLEQVLLVLFIVDLGLTVMLIESVLRWRDRARMERKWLRLYVDQCNRWRRKAYELAQIDKRLVPEDDRPMEFWQ